MYLKIIHSTLCNPGYVKGHQINPFMARAPDDHSFDPLPTIDIFKIVESSDSWPEHLTVIYLTLCYPDLLKGYFFNPFMANAP